MSQVDLGVLIGRMLGATEQAVHAQGAGVDRGTAARETYWRFGSCHRLDRDGLSFLTSPAVSVVRRGRTVLERGPGRAVTAAGLGQVDRMLHPSLLLIWGRSGEDWRLSTRVGPRTDRPGLYGIDVLSQDDGAPAGRVDVELATGRVLQLELPDLRWTAHVVTEDATDWDLERLFGDVLP